MQKMAVWKQEGAMVCTKRHTLRANNKNPSCRVVTLEGFGLKACEYLANCWPLLLKAMKPQLPKI